MGNLSSVALILSAVDDYDHYVLYSVDPGAMGNMELLALELCKIGRPPIRVTEGYSRDRSPGSLSWDAFVAKVRNREIAGRLMLILGPQTQFSKTMDAIRFSRQYGISTFFLFDHWSITADHFIDAATQTVVFPDHVGIMDESAKIRFERIFASDFVVENPMPLIHIVGHPALEAGVEKVRSISAQSVRDYKRGIGADEAVICLFLSEPVSLDFGRDNQDRPRLGYTEYSILEFFLAEYPLEGKCVVVKPHPRENANELGDFLREKAKSCCARVLLETNQSLELLLAVADEVVGMTTVALALADAVGKPVASLQLGRNDEGRRISNPFLEDHLFA